MAQPQRDVHLFEAPGPHIVGQVVANIGALRYMRRHLPQVRLNPLAMSKEGFRVVFGIGGLMRFRTNVGEAKDTGRVILVTVVIIIGILLGSMIADAIDENELVTGKRQEGMFSSAIAFTAKARPEKASRSAGTCFDRPRTSGSTARSWRRSSKTSGRGGSRTSSCPARPRTA